MWFPSFRLDLWCALDDLWAKYGVDLQGMVSSTSSWPRGLVVGVVSEAQFLWEQLFPSGFVWQKKGESVFWSEIV